MVRRWLIDQHTAAMAHWARAVHSGNIAERDQLALVIAALSAAIEAL